MLRLVLFLLGIVAVATGLSWLADRPGLIVVNWEGYEGEVSVFHAVVGLTFLLGLAILLWSLARSIWTSPATVGNYFYKRRQKRGLDALSSGIIAIGAGDRTNAARYAVQARKSLPNEPLTHLLRAQAAQLSGDKTTARRIFEAMLSQPDTEQLGLRGLYLEAEREGELEAARQFAERALSLNPRLAWSAEALFDLQCKSADWVGAQRTLAMSKKHGHVDKTVADRRRAVLLTAQAQKAEEQDPERALGLALEAHNLAPNLVPAAAIAGRMLASRGNTPKATKVLQQTWLKSPHPDLAAAYAFARIGDSPRDRLDRVKQLAALAPNVIESPIAIARAAIEARDFDTARTALEPHLESNLTQRVATLMARIESEEHGNKGRVREWLARAATAARDPAWIADGVISDTWAPVSPVTSQLDAFEWRVPPESIDTTEAGLIAERFEELLGLGTPVEAIDAKPIATPAAATRPAVTSAAQADAETGADVKSTTLPATPGLRADIVDAEPVTTTVPARPAPAPAPAGTAPAPSEPAAATAATAQPPTEAVSPPSPIQQVPKPVAAPSAAPTLTNEATTPAAERPDAPAKPSAGPQVVATGAGTDTGSKEVATAGPGQSATVDTAAKVPASTTPARRSESEPKIFVSPRAPDDPGPDAGDSVEIAAPLPRYGTTKR